MSFHEPTLLLDEAIVLRLGFRVPRGWKWIIELGENLGGVGFRHFAQLGSLQFFQDSTSQFPAARIFAGPRVDVGLHRYKYSA